MSYREDRSSAPPIEVPYEVLAASAPDAIVTVDADSCILSVNPAMERIFGWRASELLGRSLSIIIPPELRAAHEAGMSRYLRSGQRNIPWTGIRVPALTRDGRRIPIEISFGEFVHEGRHIFSGFLRDVSERVAQQERLERTTQELTVALATLRERVVEAEEARRAADAANQAKSQFLATMSHELRTPLNAIGGYVELLESGIRGQVSDEQRSDLLRIARAQQRLLALVNDVLNFARIETGRVEYDVREVRVSPLLCSLGALVDPQVRTKSLRYECDPGDPALTVCADQQKLEQVMLNLLSNAVKFTPDGGRVSISTDADEDAVRLHVTDTGPGIPADRLQAIFEPFVQVDAALTRVHGGTGLGLAISQELARGMGGFITVASTPGVGSCFSVCMPTGTACIATRPLPTAGEMLAQDARGIVRGLVSRMRAEPELPVVTDAEIEDHTASLLADLAQLLVILDSGAGTTGTLVRDGARIQETIVDLHGRQRRRLGWTPALMRREFDLLADETVGALLRRAREGSLGAAEEVAALVRALLGEACEAALRSLRA
ncbi:MAG: sensor protein [Gemmatimonadetes bacterium]|jgi:PAS domain S-box-containing protein|nr:sensor protein [Gemmatimonadota bacterium]